MQAEFENEIMEYLTERRTCSLGNLAIHFGKSVDEMMNVVESLIAQNRVRTSNSKCASGCSSCSGCDGLMQVPILEDKTILISLELREEE